MPVAVNVWLVPRAMLGVAGVMAIDSSIAGVTVRVMGGEVTLPTTAVRRVVPVVSDVATPGEPAALLMVATAGVAEFQVTWVVRFCVELSE